MISRRLSSTPTTRRSSRPLARTASQAGSSSTTGSATSATSRLSSAMRILACSARRSTPAAEPGQSTIQRSAPQQSPVADSDTDPQTGSVLFVRVLCASAVRVGVCGGRVRLGALRFRKNKNKNKEKEAYD